MYTVCVIFFSFVCSFIRSYSVLSLHFPLYIRLMLNICLLLLGAHLSYRYYQWVSFYIYALTSSFIRFSSVPYSLHELNKVTYGYSRVLAHIYPNIHYKHTYTHTHTYSVMLNLYINTTTSMTCTYHERQGVLLRRKNASCGSSSGNTFQYQEQSMKLISNNRDSSVCT